MLRFSRMSIRIGWVLLLLWSCHALADGKGPLPARQPPAEDGRLRLSAEDRCPICGMFPVKRPKHAAAMVLSDGRSFYFCGNGCLLRTFRNPDAYLRVAADKIQTLWVQDYFTGMPLDAHQAWWVAGSDVIGPMGPALVALSDERSVATFRERHSGEIVFQIDQADEEQWLRILPKKH